MRDNNEKKSKRLYILYITVKVREGLFQKERERNKQRLIGDYSKSEQKEREMSDEMCKFFFFCFFFFV